VSKFLYTFLFLTASFSASSSYAMVDSEEWFVDKESEHKGTVFPTAVCTYTKEKNESTGFIRHSPKKSTALTPATVEFIAPDAILHNKYYEKRTAHLAVQSFNVTPNPTHLTAKSEDLSSLPTKPYGSIPVKLSTVTKNLELLIFSDSEAVVREDYGQTMAGAVEVILSQYIPMAQTTGHFSDLQTVTITDGTQSIATALLKKAESESLPFTLQSYLPIQSEINPSWNIVFRTKDK